MLLRILSGTFPALKMNVDLADCDKILRVEGDHIKPAGIMIVVKDCGFNCEILD